MQEAHVLLRYFRLGLIGEACHILLERLLASIGAHMEPTGAHTDDLLGQYEEPIREYLLGTLPFPRILRYFCLFAPIIFLRMFFYEPSKGNDLDHTGRFR